MKFCLFDNESSCAMKHLDIGELQLTCTDGHKHYVVADTVRLLHHSIAHAKEAVTSPIPHGLLCHTLPSGFADIYILLSIQCVALNK